MPIIPQLQDILNEIAATPEHGALVFPNILKGAENEVEKRKRTSQENQNVLKRIRQVCHEVLGWNKSINPSGTWARHSFANNLHSEGVDMDYISESMGHSIPDHSVTQMYIDHYPLEKQMEYNKKLLPSTGRVTPREALMAKLSTMSDEDIAKLLNMNVG